MGDSKKTPEELLREIRTLRRRISELERARGRTDAPGGAPALKSQGAPGRGAEFQGLLDASHAVLRHRKFEDAAREIFDSCKALTGAKAGYVALLSEDRSRNEVLFLDAGGLPCTVDPMLPMPLRGLRQEAYRTGSVVFDNDFPRSRWAGFMPEGHVRLDNVMFVPLKVAGVARGIMGLANKPGGFGEDDARVAGAFGEMAALALMNSLNAERLNQSNERFHAVAQSTNDAIISTDRRGEIVFWNRGAEKTFGYGEAEVLGKPVTMIIPEPFRGAHAKAFAGALAAGPERPGGSTLEALALRKNGEEFPVELSLARWRTEEGVFFTAIIRDISERKHSEAVLQKAHDELEHQVNLRTAALLEAADELESEIIERRRTEKALTNILESLEEGLMVVDSEYRILSANRAYCGLLGKSIKEVMGRRCFELLMGRDRPCFEDGEECIVQRTFLTGEPASLTRTNYYSGRKGPVFLETKSYPMKDEAGDIVSVIQIINDITEKRRLEEELRHSQKMKAVGQLAGGIAHDFNNRLAAIINYCYILKLKMKPGDPLRTYVEQILRSSEMAASLTQGLLSFSRKQVLNPRPVRLNDIVSGAEKLIAQVTGEEIELRMQLHDGDLIVMADSGQLEHVLLNLATNARDAIDGPGRITIRTGRADLGYEFFGHRADGSPGPYALLSFNDSGSGMDSETLQKVFEPFFTTKDIGEGTGLGLSMVYGIIKQHGGFIKAQSEPGAGTTFNIYLPILESQGVQPEAPSKASPVGGTETVLIAEDEEDVRRPLKQMLESFGYEVVEAVDGEDAVEKFTSLGNGIGLLILDIMLPRLSGSDAFRRIRELNPDVKAIFTSGYAADYIQKKGLMESGAAFLSKPVSPDVLLGAIREVLDR